MRCEPVLLSYAGLACLALTSQRIRRDITLPLLPTVGVLRALAVTLFSLAAWRAVHHFGVYQGPVALVGMVTAAGLPLVLLLSRWPQTGLLLGLGSFTLAIGTIALGFIK